MTKRIISFLLMVFMILSFTACGDGKDTSSPSESNSASNEAEISIDTNQYINDDGTITVPDLTNMPLEQARALLKQLGLKSKFTEEYDKTDKFEVGHVMRTDYEAGEKVKKGTQIFLTIRKEGKFIDPNEPYTDPLVEARGDLEQGANSDYKPLNYETMKAVWISQFDLKSVLRDSTLRSEESLREIFGNLCESLVKDGYNTVIVQVRPYGDSFYPSAYYPWSEYVMGSYGLYASYDPLKVMIEEAHDADLSFQAWINPMRAYSKDNTFELINVSYKTRVWYDNPEKYPNYIYKHKTNYYLNVAYDEVRQLIIDGAAEIVRYYDVDGIHMDDYFYPSGIPNDFDDAPFKESGEFSRTQFRKANISKLVKGLYSAVKKENKNVLFGISPAGNIQNVRLSCCLDIDLILSQKGFVDYIMPQIYWGFEHDTQPFKQCLQNWQKLVKEPSIKFMIGITASNIAEPTGEFINNKDIFRRYLLHAQSTDMFDGICVFSVGTLYNVLTANPSTNEGVKKEMKNFLPDFKIIPNNKISY